MRILVVALAASACFFALGVSASAERDATGSELKQIQKAAVAKCKRTFKSPEDKYCKSDDARISTVDGRYAIGGSTGFLGSHVAMLKKVGGRWRVKQYPYGNFVAFLCSYAKKVFPRPVSRDFGLNDSQGDC